MANFNALFAGCESFMEGDVEINNDVTVPAGDAAEAIEAETEAADVGAEGSEIAGDVDTEDTKAEATNMVFDQLTAMYRHVKRYGVDRTFLSLYNSNGQLNQMVGYKFPSCESIDSVGSPRSQASRAFIIAMEEDGIFKRIWTWIKETFAKIMNFIIKVIDWFREACGNVDLRIGKLREYFRRSTPRTWEEQRSRSVLYYDSGAVSRFNDAARRLLTEINSMATAGRSGATGGSAPLTIAAFSEEVSNQVMGTMTALQAAISTRADTHTGPDAYGSSRDRDDEHGAKQLSRYVDRVKKDLIRPVKDALKDVAKDKEQVESITGTNGLAITYTQGTGYAVTALSHNNAQVAAQTIAAANLTVAANVSQEALRFKQGCEKIKANYKHCQQIAQQASQQDTGASLTHEQNTEARRNTATAMKALSLLTDALGIEAGLLPQTAKQTASLQTLVTSTTGTNNNNNNNNNNNPPAPAGNNNP